METREAWIEREYDGFRSRARRDLFLSIAIFCHQNRPIDGYYMEFGCHNARTFRLAYDAFRVLFESLLIASTAGESSPLRIP